MNNKKIIIKCPQCGCEYLPAEIFVSSSILGQPHNIVRNEKGEIEYYEGDSIDLVEEYTCDKCGCKFSIGGNIDFSTNKIIEEVDEFDEDSIVIKLK